MYSDDFLEEKWRGLEDIPFDEDENGRLYLAEDWWVFKKGAYREEEIWTFFDKYHSKGVHWLLYEFDTDEN